MLRDLKPKQITTIIAGKEYNILPVSLNTQLKILHYFEELEGQAIAWNTICEILATGDPKYNSHFVYCMVEFEKPTTYEDFLKLLDKDKGKTTLVDDVGKAYVEAMPKGAVRQAKKKMVQTAITSLIITSALICWLLGIIYLLKSFSS